MKRPLFGVVLAATLAFFSCQSDDSVEDLCASMDDEVFKNYCYEHFDTNADGKLSQAEANVVYTIYISGLDVRSLNGIEHFTKLEELAVEECENLREVVIPNTVPLLIFKDCNNLESFYGKYASLDNRCVIVDGKLCAFAPSGLTEYTIPDGVTSIGNGAFNFCKNLTSITIPDSVTRIGYDAFCGCKNLTSFYGKFVSADNRCVIVDGELCAFAPSGLTEYTIPDSVTSIGGFAFNGCKNLKSVYCKATTPPAGGYGMFAENPGGHKKGHKIYVPRNAVEAYKSADGWREYVDAIIGYDF